MDKKVIEDIKQLNSKHGVNTPNGLKDKFDVTMMVLHSCMRHHSFKTILQNPTTTTETTNTGTSDSNNNNNNDNIHTDKELVIPDGWNSNTDSYHFNYKRTAHDKNNTKTYVLKCLRMGNVLLVNGMVDGSSTIFTFDVDVNVLVQNTDYSNVDGLFNHLSELLQLFERTIIWALVPELKKDTPTTTDNPQQQQQQQSLRDDRRPPYYYGGGGGGNNGIYFGGGFGIQPQPPRFVGDEDLHAPGLPRFSPLGGPGPSFPGTGSQVGRNNPGFGNVHYPYGNEDDYYSPYGPERLPRGAVPPGARFDPFGPPLRGPGGNNRFSGPDPDHLNPPGFNNNFF
eukprot:gene631-782_t